MKKIIFGICAVAFVTLASLNVSLALKGEYVVKLSLSNMVSLANAENTGGNGDKKPVITSTVSILETYTRHSDGAQCQKFEKTIVCKCEQGGTSLCTEYRTTEEGISCTVFP